MRQEETASLSMVGIPLEQVGAIKKIFEGLNQALKLGADIVEKKENLNNNEAEEKLEKAKDFLGVIKGVDITNEQIKEVRALSRLRA